MENFLQLENNGYTVKISMENIDIEDIPTLLEELSNGLYNWFNFPVGEILYYNDGWNELVSIGLNTSTKEVIFE